jgi:hypothetical protein
MAGKYGSLKYIECDHRTHAMDHCVDLDAVAVFVNCNSCTYSQPLDGSFGQASLASKVWVVLGHIFKSTSVGLTCMVCTFNFGDIYVYHMAQPGELMS